MVLISTFVQIERRLFLSKFFPVVVVSLIFPVVKNMNEVRSAVWRVGLGCQLKMKDGLRLGPRFGLLTDFVPKCEAITD